MVTHGQTNQGGGTALGRFNTAVEGAVAYAKHVAAIGGGEHVLSEEVRARALPSALHPLPSSLFPLPCPPS